MPGGQPPKGHRDGDQRQAETGERETCQPWVGVDVLRPAETDDEDAADQKQVRDAQRQPRVADEKERHYGGQRGGEHETKDDEGANEIVASHAGSQRFPICQEDMHAAVESLAVLRPRYRLELRIQFMPDRGQGRVLARCGADGAKQAGAASADEDIGHDVEDCVDDAPGEVAADGSEQHGMSAILTVAAHDTRGQGEGQDHDEAGQDFAETFIGIEATDERHGQSSFAASQMTTGVHLARLPAPEARSVSSAQTITSRPVWDRTSSRPARRDY